MELLVDIGNSRIKWAPLDGDRLGSGHEVSRDGGSAGVIASVVAACAAPPRRVLVSNVGGPEAGAAFADAVEAAWRVPVDFAATRAVCGSVRVAYSDHRQLGVDRWLAMLAAHARFDGSACIVDAGTAVTIDGLAADGRHLGGFIVPGLGLMWRALTAGTGDLERFGAADERNDGCAGPEFGRSTADAMRNGAAASICALVERCAAKMRAEDPDTVVILTGGDAPAIAAHLDLEIEHRPQLVLEGLAAYRSAVHS